MRILSVSDVQALEKASDAAGHSYAQMMDLAGQGVARALLERIAVKSRRILVLVGPGNNGGDGLVAARYLSEAGASVTAYLSRPRDSEQDPVFKRAVERGTTIVEAGDDTAYTELRRLVTGCHILIDALLGTGATPPLRGTIAEVLENVHAALTAKHMGQLISLNGVQEASLYPRPFILAVDGPSGMDFDTGALAPETLSAHLTVTFGNPKSGHFMFPAAGATGELVVADIGIPRELNVEGTGPDVVTPAMVRNWLPARPADAHKGTFGRALIVAGSVNYTGAVALAASAAVRAGAGLVTVAIPEVIHPAVIPLVPEATVLLLPNAVGALSRSAAALIHEKQDAYKAMLVGPGLSWSDETARFIQALLNVSQSRRPGFISNTQELETTEPVPLVVDADGLNILSELTGWPEMLPKPAILTPHPGEMARLTGLDTADIQANRLEHAQDYAKKWGHVVVLKGAFTVVAAPDDRTALLPFANAGLASAGTGDVLAGIIVSLRAQGMEAFQAAAAGAYLHGLAGEIARSEHGEAGMAAGDVVRALPSAIQRLGA